MQIKNHQFAPNIIREYDIRGIVHKELFLEDARVLGRILAYLSGTKADSAGYRHHKGNAVNFHDVAAKSDVPVPIGDRGW